MSKQPDPIYCSAGCKRFVMSEKEAEEKFWDFLPISRRYRCPQCRRELEAINKPKDQQS